MCTSRLTLSSDLITCDGRSALSAKLVTPAPCFKAFVFLACSGLFKQHFVTELLSAAKPLIPTYIRKNTHNYFFHSNFLTQFCKIQKMKSITLDKTPGKF